MYLLYCFYLVLVSTNTLPYSLQEKKSLSKKVLQLGMSRKGRDLYVTDDTGVTLFRNTNNQFENVTFIQFDSGYGFKDADVTEDGDWMVAITKNPSTQPKIYVSELFHSNNSFNIVQSITGLSDDHTIALSDDHLTMVVGSSQVTVYNFQQGAFNAAQTISKSANSVDLSADGEWLAIGGSNTKSWLYHLENSVYVLNRTFTHNQGSTHVELAA